MARKRGTSGQAVEEVFRAKGRRRQDLARLPFEAKIRILVELQKMASSVRAAAGAARRRPWNAQ
ncbi:MAG: hypothetical protein HYR98_01675 [Nitrospirae bacterium]|nr:hypothetical protein [Nitrospirota bacterium]MBI3393000.1 hypothetical protein [Nitrospirota bacterium]